MGPSGSGATMKRCVNTLLGLGVQALAAASTLGEKAELPHERFLHVLSETSVLSPSQKSQLASTRKGEYPAAFSLQLMFKDFGLILQQALELSVPMPITAAAAQGCAAEHTLQHAAHNDEGEITKWIATWYQLPSWQHTGIRVQLHCTPSCSHISRLFW
jgi:3-hydroxyisobutyrate dehydrogenase